MCELERCLGTRQESQLRVAFILSERDTEFVSIWGEDKQVGGYSSKRALYEFCFC